MTCPDEMEIDGQFWVNLKFKNSYKYKTTEIHTNYGDRDNTVFSFLLHPQNNKLIEN